MERENMGELHMADIAGKPVSKREAVARGRVTMRESTLSALRRGEIPKGDVWNAARVAGIMAVKETPRLVPLCHSLPAEWVDINFSVDAQASAVEVEVYVKCSAKTGVEMEALTGVCAASLTIYDMCKPLDKTMTITDVRLVKKTGGKSGEFLREGE